MQAREPFVSKLLGRVALDSWKLAAAAPLSDNVPAKAGLVGDIPTEIAPMIVPVLAPELKDEPVRPILVIVCTVGVQVTVTGKVNGEPVAPTCVATMFSVYVVHARVPLVSKFAGRLVLESWKLAALVPDNDRVPAKAGVVGDIPTEIAPMTVPVLAPLLKDEPLKPTLVIVCTIGVHVTVVGI